MRYRGSVFKCTLSPARLEYTTRKTFPPGATIQLLTSTDTTNKTTTGDPINCTANVSDIRRIFNRVSLGSSWPPRRANLFKRLHVIFSKLSELSAGYSTVSYQPHDVAEYSLPRVNGYINFEKEITSNGAHGKRTFVYCNKHDYSKICKIKH